jgi:hypothetical protein
VSINARFIDLAPGHVSVRLSNLRFTPDGPATGNPGELVITGLLAGTSVYTDKPPIGGRGGWQNIPVQLRRFTDAKGGRITVEVLDLAGGASLSWEWIAGSALTGSLHLLRPGSDAVKLLEVMEDPDAQTPSNSFHRLSELAIPALQNQLLADPLKDTGFATYAEQALFPPPDPKSTLDVIATLDWVLFARRRECSCHADAPAPTPNPPRRFKVYWVDADRLPEGFSLSKDDLGSIQDRLHEVDIVTFQAGSTVLDQPKAAADHLRFQVSGNTLQWAVIAMHDPTDPTPIESGRLTSYIGAVGEVLDISHPDPPVVLTKMPPALVDANASGMIVVAVSTLRLLKALVYRVSVPQQVTRVVPDPIVSLKVGRLKVLSFSPFTLVGVYDFQPNGKLQDATKLAQDFNIVANGVPFEGRLFFADTKADIKRVKQSSQEVLTVLKATTPPIVPEPDTKMADAALFAEAPIVIVLGTRQTT